MISLGKSLTWSQHPRHPVVMLFLFLNPSLKSPLCSRDSRSAIEFIPVRYPVAKSVSPPSDGMKPLALERAAS